MSASCPNRWTATTAENIPRASSRRLRIHRQEPRVHVDEDRPMARGHDGPDQRRIRKQGEGYARPRLQIERAQQQPERLPAAARPELRAVAKQSERSREAGRRGRSPAIRPRNRRLCRAMQIGEWSASGKSA